jgi:hypothetical protein
VLILKLGLLQTFETAEGHRQDGVSLILSKAEAFIETAGRFLIGLGVPDDMNDFVDVVVAGDEPTTM